MVDVEFVRELSPGEAGWTGTARLYKTVLGGAYFVAIHDATEATGRSPEATNGGIFPTDAKGRTGYANFVHHVPMSDRESHEEVLIEAGYNLIGGEIKKKRPRIHCPLY